MERESLSYWELRGPIWANVLLYSMNVRCECLRALLLALDRDSAGPLTTKTLWSVGPTKPCGPRDKQSFSEAMVYYHAYFTRYRGTVRDKPTSDTLGGTVSRLVGCQWGWCA